MQGIFVFKQIERAKDIDDLRTKCESFLKAGNCTSFLIWPLRADLHRDEVLHAFHVHSAEAEGALKGGGNI
jgi:hypothetical protein